MLTHYTKYITDQEYQDLKRLFYEQKNPSLGLIFECLAVFAMRIGDCVKIKKSNLNNDLTELTYIEEKTEKIRRIFIPSFMKIKLLEHIKNEFIINEDYLFKPMGRSANAHIQENTIRAIFIKYRKIYQKNEGYYRTTRGKKLYRVTPHTLKHYGTLKFLKASKYDYGLTQQFTNHSKIDFVVHYAKTLEGIERQANILEEAYT